MLLLYLRAQSRHVINYLLKSWDTAKTPRKITEKILGEENASTYTHQTLASVLLLILNPNLKKEIYFDRILLHKDYFPLYILFCD